MGSGISDNYENIESLFIIGFWKVHTAVKKQTNEQVCLWLLDQEKLKAQIKKKADREQFLRQQMEGLQQMRRLCHPHMLKIFELSEDISSLSFSSEPIFYSLIYEGTFSEDETTYIAMQLAEVCSFLQNTAKIGLLGISQQSICLTKSMEVKICNLAFASPILNENGLIGSKIGAYTAALNQPDINFTAPEVISNQQILVQSDVFSYGALLLTLVLKRIAFSPGSAQDLIAQAQTVPMQIPTTVAPELKELIISCCQVNPTLRPTFDTILLSNTFTSLEMRVLKYMDMIITKENADKFTFFKNLPTALPSFSPRMLRNKFAPIFISEVQNEIRFGPLLIPFCVTIGKDMDNDEFYKQIVVPLAKFFTVSNPPDVLSSVFAVLDVLVNKIDKDKQYDIIYPIFISALQSNSPRLHNEATEHIPLLINSMTQQSIQASFFPRLLEFITQTNDISTIQACIKCMVPCTVKIDSDWFAQTVLPKLLEVVLKRNSPEFAAPIAEMLEKVRPSTESCLKYVIPLSSTILSLPQVENHIQLKFCNIISGVVDRIKKERKLFEPSKLMQTAKQNVAMRKEQASPTKASPAKVSSNPHENETSADIFGTAARVQQQQQRPTVLPKTSPAVSQPPASQPEQANESEENHDADDAINEVVAAPSPKKSSMFSGLTVQSGSARQRPNAWKRGGHK